MHVSINEWGMIHEFNKKNTSHTISDDINFIYFNGIISWFFSVWRLFTIQS